MQSSRIFAVSILALGVLAACDKNDKSTAETTAAQQQNKTEPAKTAEPAASGAATTKSEPVPTTTAAVPPVGPVVTFGKDVGLSTPESVLYDPTTDRYIVSNIDGKPLEADGKGFISKLTPEGKVETLKWIESGKNKATLNAPKGLGFLGDMLVVADLDTVRMFDRKTGAPMGEVKVPGATFLNDVAEAGDHVLVSDTGMKQGASGFEPTGTDAVYSIDKTKKLTTVAKGKELGNPNGLLVVNGKTWVVTFGSGEIYSLDDKGKKSDAQKLPKGQLDGILPIGAGELLVTSWESSTVYRGRPGATWTAAIEGVKSPADIGYDAKRFRVLVPLFMENEIRAYDVK